MGTLANVKDQDYMQHNAAFNRDLHCLLRLIQPSRTENHLNVENAISDPFKYQMGSPMLMISICMENPSKYKGLIST